ncbi:MAG: hypothetical protein LBQ27_05785, partial [Clostridiales bacterium]|nr:hypothetical protein [Clostridiales bacterium]
RLAEEERLREEQAEAERAEEEARRLEEERLAEEEAKRLEEERLAEEEAKRLEEERLAEEEAKRLEEERLAEEEARRLEEEERLREEQEAAEAAAYDEERRIAEENRIIEERRIEEERSRAEQEAAATKEKKKVSEDDDEDDDEAPIMDDTMIDVPEGYTYQDGWYYISETGERVERIGIRDDYYENLPDELKPEFRDLFVEGKKINIPRFPFYVIEGDNTMFFRLVFTFITRYRKVISIELLDNLYEYLVNKFLDNSTVISKLNDKLIRIYFARRKEKGILQKCEAKCREDVEYCFTNVPNYPSNLYSYKRLVMILERTDRLAEARDLCRKALEIGLVDGTKAGYKGRLDRIEKRLEEEAILAEFRAQ